MENIYRYLPERINNFFRNYESASDVTEIRLRVNNTLQLTERGKIKYIPQLFFNQNEIDNIFHAMCENSQNVYDNDISNGYITVKNGYRVGIGGDYYYNEYSKKYVLRSIKSLNIRIPAKEVSFINQEKLLSTIPDSMLIIGPPHSGKTTLIKIYAKYLADKYRICICDERREIYNKKTNCDVIQGIKKATAVSMATRTLNPQFIICDEIGSTEEANEIISAVNTGVKFICSAHATTVNDIYKRPNIKILIDNDIFKRIVVLSSENNNFCIKEIADV